MIFDSIHNYNNYKGYPELYQVLSFLAGLGEGEAVKPNTVLAEERIFCNPVQFVSKASVNTRHIGNTLTCITS